MSEKKIQHIIERVIGYICDVCGDDLPVEPEPHARLINDIGNSWYQADFCQPCYKKVADFVENLGGKIEDKHA